MKKYKKKRGRKPKVKSIETDEKVPKKRGRKPKEKVYSVKELPKTFFEENKNETFILHLPIKVSDLNSNSPLPTLNNNTNYSMYDDDIDLYKVNENNLLPTQLNLLNNTNNLFFDNDDLFIDKEIINDDTELKIKEPEIKEDDNKNNKVIKKNLRNILYEFINANNDKVWPDSTKNYTVKKNFM